jgi:hypothetical protein
LLGRDLFHAEYRAVVVVVDIHHLLHHGQVLATVEQVVGEHHGERRVADELGGAQHGVAQAQRLGLAHVEALDVRWLDRAHHIEQCLLVLGLEFRFQFVALSK